MTTSVNRLAPVAVFAAALQMLPGLVDVNRLRADDGRPSANTTLTLSEDVRSRCLSVLRAGLESDEFWPSIHAAEGLTLAGHEAEVKAFLEPQLKTQTDDQKRCGIARELVRAGDRSKVSLMLDILAKDDRYGHVHAAESLYKVGGIGDGRLLRAAMEQTDNPVLQIMAAAALGRNGSPQAMQLLRERADDANPDVNRLAAWVLGRIGDASDIPRLQEIASHTTDASIRCYSEHALAALGDAAGRKALAKNIRSNDPAIRTYAAVFAGDARMTSLADPLTALLDDENEDVRYRAAQSLLVLSRPAGADRKADFSVDVFPATEKNPRYTEGSVIELRDGSLLLATTEFDANTSDFAKARIVGRTSSDGGRSWGNRRVLQENTGGLNVMSVTLRRLSEPIRDETSLGMYYLVKNSFDDLRVYLRESNDEGRTFGEPIRVTTEPGYHVMNNDRVTRLSTGRLLAPVASTADVKRENHFVCRCYLSDDAGQTWREGKGAVDFAKRGAMEPEVIEMNDSRVLMIFRNQLGYIAASHSEDGGDTWSAPASWGVKAPEAPATLRRVPATGDLLLVWNNTFVEGTGHGGKRTPLTAAISSDEGRTWKHVKNLEDRSDQTYSYTSLTFVRDRALLTYWVNEGKRYSLRFRSLPVSWFYK